MVQIVETINHRKLVLFIYGLIAYVKNKMKTRQLRK